MLLRYQVIEHRVSDVHRILRFPLPSSAVTGSLLADSIVTIHRCTIVAETVQQRDK
jgi:hypothetical protein